MNQIQCLVIANSGAVIHDGSACETGDVIVCDENDAAKLVSRGLATIVSEASDGEQEPSEQEPAKTKKSKKSDGTEAAASQSEEDKEPWDA